MKKQYVLILGILFSFNGIAQTGIGTTSPNTSAKLEVASTDKGFLPPRVALTATNAFSPIVGTAANATGLLVYNTATTTNSVIGLVMNSTTTGYVFGDTI